MIWRFSGGTHRIARLPARGDETILLVEDDEDVRELAREGLMLRGYKVGDLVVRHAQVGVVDTVPEDEDTLDNGDEPAAEAAESESD